MLCQKKYRDVLRNDTILDRKGPPYDRSRVAKEYYESLADDFEELDKYWANPYDDAAWEAENELIQRYLGNKNLLLDLGVGFYPHVESTSEKRLICLDISYPSLLIARKVYHRNNRKMEYICGDALSLPFVDNAFEGIIAGGELINHIRGEDLLKELYRVLKPGGKAVLSIAMKWCIDSFYAILDSLLGNKIGYSMTREEAFHFMAHPKTSTDVTWEVTPDFDLRVTLYSYSNFKQMLSQTAFRIVHIQSLNLLSAIIPIPLQQNAKSSKVIREATRLLLWFEQSFLGKVPGIRWFAGNIYLVLEKP